MKFCKMNGAGNDFLIFNNMEENLPRDCFPHMAKVLCHRHLSIGADGLMVVERAENGGDYKMLFYNSDGSTGEMCGNGARCICRYGYEKGLAGEVQRVESPSGLVTGQRIDARNYRIRLTDPTVIRPDLTLEVDGTAYPCAYVELGNPGLPHLVVEVKDLKDRTPDSLRALGAALRSHPTLPKGANVNFYQITGPDEVLELTYERGVEDFTYACGTGTGSTVLILTQRGLVSGEDVRVTVPGGLLRLTVDRGCSTIRNLFLTGPTNIVCEGTVLDEDLRM